MDTIEKSKNKGRPYPLRRVLLVMVMGVAFMFWMPFVIITETYFHWLNYVIYWGAALIWLMPLVRWLKRHVYAPRLHRLRTVILLVVVWLFLIGGGWFVTKRGLLPPIRDNDLRCVVWGDNVSKIRYLCNIPALPGRYEQWEYDPICLQGQYSRSKCFFISSRMFVEAPNNFPIALMSEIHTGFYFEQDLFGDLPVFEM